MNLTSQNQNVQSIIINLPINITISGTSNVYDSVETIPDNIIRLNPSLQSYDININIASVEVQRKLDTFIIWRLIDKLDHQLEMKQLNFKQSKIPTLLFSNRFMSAFRTFLICDKIIIVKNMLRNRIRQLQGNSYTDEMRQRDYMIMSQLQSKIKNIGIIYHSFQMI
jgi:hypothetical protein